MLFFLQDKGYFMQVGDETLTVHGAALCMLGDTPASNFIGGFKESVAFALRKCRRCMTTATDMSEKVSKLLIMLTKFMLISYNIDSFRC